jgi:phosphopantetheinyl transferase
MIKLAFASFTEFESTFSSTSNEDIFGEQERSEYLRLKVPKRSSEWAASRVAVKKLICACVPELARYKYPQIQICKEPAGVPFIEVDTKYRLPGWLSLSHSTGCVLAAYSPDNIRFGVDLEFIEPRSIDFVRDYFTESEILQALSGDLTQATLAATLIWSAKEAVLKAMSEGLRVDTRKLEIVVPSDLFNGGEWAPLGINCVKLKIPSPHLFWRREGNFIQTICWLENPDQELMWVQI